MTKQIVNKRNYLTTKNQMSKQIVNERIWFATHDLPNHQILILSHVSDDRKWGVQWQVFTAISIICRLQK